MLQTSTSSVYDADNRVYSSTDDLGGVTTTVYDANGNVIQTTTPDGMVTDTVYDDQGRVIYTDDPHRPGEPSNGTHTSYDSDGNVIDTEELADVVITVNTTGVDVGTSVLTSVGTMLSATSTMYDAAGRVTKTVDASGMETDNTYDDVGNLISSTEIVDQMSRTTSSIYNALGQVTSTTDARGNPTQYQYNSSGQVTKTTYADGSSVTDEYDSRGNKIAEIDQNGVETQYVYNAYGELTEVMEPSVTDPTTGEAVNPTYQYGYDIYGDQVSMTDAENNTTTYAYDPNGNMVQETLPMGQTESWQYNGVGQETEFTDFDGNVTDYAYYGTGSPDGAPGELDTKTVYAYNNLTTPYETVTYEYNQNYTPQGSYQNIVNDSLSGITTSTYDVNGNLVQITSPQGTINYTYDPATGEEIEVSSPDPVSGTDTDTHFSYDQAGELKLVTVTALDDQTLSSPLVTAYSYDLDGNLVYTQNANGTTETRTYNDLNELTSIVDANAWGTYASFAYTYDLAGHVLTETDLGGATDKYNYDSLYRLTLETISDPATGSSSYWYVYDLVGNRVSETDTTSSGTVTQGSVFNANDELTSVTNTSTGDVQNYCYDADGNTTRITDTNNNVIASYTWSPSGQMTGAVTGGNTVLYTYDAAGNRTSEAVNDQTTTFLNDPNQAYDQVLEEYAEGGVLAATFIRGIDLLFEDQSGTLSYYATDNLGSTRALTNSAGAVTETYSYDAFGNLIANTGTTTNPYLFTGQWFDSAIAQYYNRARYYDASTGRLTSRDSYDGQLADPVTANHYAYAGADPTGNIDPSGHFSVGTLTAVSIGVALSGFTLGFSYGLARQASLIWTWDPNAFVPVDPGNLQVWVTSARVHNPGHSADAYFARLVTLKDAGVVTAGPPSSSSGVDSYAPFPEVGSAIGFDFKSNIFAGELFGAFYELGQGDFFVRVVKYDPTSRFFVARTLSGHPLAGWRAWQVSQLPGGDILLKTYAVEEPATLLNAGESYLGGHAALLQTWKEQMLNIVAALGGTIEYGSPDTSVNGRRDFDVAPYYASVQ